MSVSGPGASSVLVILGKLLLWLKGAHPGSSCPSEADSKSYMKSYVKAAWPGSESVELNLVGVYFLF